MEKPDRCHGDLRRCDGHTDASGHAQRVEATLRRADRRRPDRGDLMPPTVEDRLSDIRTSISQIERITSNMTLERFASDITIRAATERFLEIVCEASRQLPNDIK